MSSQTQEHVLPVGVQKLIRSGNFIEPEGLEIFSLPMLQGSRAGLKDPHSILLSASLAKALFANANPLGQIIRMDDSLSVKITGVYGYVFSFTVDDEQCNDPDQSDT